MSGFELFGTGLVGLLLIFAAAFLYGRRIANFSVVDVVWSYAFGVLAIFYALAGSGWWIRRTVIAGMAIAWSFRLGTHLLRRVSALHPKEEGRYIEMRQSWQKNLDTRMFTFYQLQAASVAILGLPFLFASSNAASSIHPLEIAGIAVWILALIGEAVADGQLDAFKRQPGNRGKVCDVGLWRYSRHPNYFCEWLIWIGFFLFGCGSPWGWAGIASPLAILYLLLKVTGVPPTEEQSIRSKGDAYRRYQQTTNAFIPGPPRPAKR